MALIDLKSDLSKFRKPTETPLVDSPRNEVPKFVNQTPLSDLLNGVPILQKPDKIGTKTTITPNQYNNTEKFKGETQPTPASQVEKFKGETQPTLASQVEKFKGETQPTLASQVEKFKGETQQTLASQIEKFKGETQPTLASQVEKFKGEVQPILYNNTEEFKGETQPILYNNTEEFKGETNPTLYDNTEEFKGETQQTLASQVEKFKGETTSKLFTFNPKLDERGKSFKVVDFFTNDDAVGFTAKVDTLSKFVGVDPSQTIFDTTTSIRSFKDTPVPYKNSLQLDNGLGRSYTDSILKDTYNGKTNKSGGNAHGLLKQDSFNTWIIKEPFIVTGIQNGKGKDFNYGVGGLSFIRGGAVTSTTRAVLDVFRISQFLLTPRGIIWGLKQVGLQRSQRWGKIWTPINLLATIGGQHIGFRPNRQGLFPGDDTGRYFAGKIEKTYSQLAITGDGLPFLLSTDKRGGFNSVYGIGITTTLRGGNTFNNPNQKYGAEIANYEFLSYGKIKKRANAGVSTTPTDFRSLYDAGTKDAGTKKDIATKVDYTAQNIHKSYGLPNPLSSDNKIAKYLSGDDSVKKFSNDISVDPINESVFNPTLVNDYVHLFFATDNRAGAQDSTKIIQFRSTISGLTETYSPSYTNIKYPGRADQGYVYDTFERTLSFNFKIHANSRREMKTMWLKIQELAKLTLPEYSGGAYSGQIVFFRLGDIWGEGTNGIPSVITSLTYTYDDEYSWDLNSDGKLGELPMGIDAAISLTILPGESAGGRRYDVDGLALYSYNDKFKAGKSLDKSPKSPQASITQPESAFAIVRPRIAKII